MELSFKEKTIKYSVYCAILLALSFIQNVPGLSVEIAGARCFLLIPACVLLGLGEDERASALLGLFAGLLWDAVSLQHKGFSCIILMLMCYTVAALAVFIFRNTFWYAAASAVVCIVIYVLLYWLLFVVFGGGDGAGYAFVHFYLPSMGYTLAVTPILYFIFRPIKAKLNKKADED